MRTELESAGELGVSMAYVWSPQLRSPLADNAPSIYTVTIEV
jgi:hypothetical protein